MKMPDSMPTMAAGKRRFGGGMADLPRLANYAFRADEGLAPAACCAEVCANVPFVGRVCHCALELPICP